MFYREKNCNGFEVVPFSEEGFNEVPDPRDLVDPTFGMELATLF